MPRRKSESRKPARPYVPEPSPPAPYQVRLSSTAVKDLKDLGPFEAKAVRALRRLMDNPLAGHPLTGELKGLRSLELSLPGGYRAVYPVKPKERVCLVVMVGPDEGLYERAARRVATLRRQGVVACRQPPRPPAVAPSPFPQQCLDLQPDRPQLLV